MRCWFDSWASISTRPRLEATTSPYVCTTTVRARRRDLSPHRRRVLTRSSSFDSVSGAPDWCTGRQQPDHAAVGYPSPTTSSPTRTHLSSSSITGEPPLLATSTRTASKTTTAPLDRSTRWCEAGRCPAARLVFGPDVRTRRSRTAVRTCSPIRGYIAQPVVSSTPTLVDGALPPPPRPATVRGQRREKVWVLPGGLTRASREQPVVNSSQGAGSKDTWVLADADDDPASTSRHRCPWPFARRCRSCCARAG